MDHNDTLANFVTSRLKAGLLPRGTKSRLAHKQARGQAQVQDAKPVPNLERKPASRYRVPEPRMTTNAEQFAALGSEWSGEAHDDFNPWPDPDAGPCPRPYNPDFYECMARAPRRRDPRQVQVLNTIHRQARFQAPDEEVLTRVRSEWQNVRDERRR